MARRRRARRTRGSRSGRLTGRLGAVLVIVALVAWFAFTQLFFDPFEESQPGFDLLVPRDVDVYARRERLDSDFASFPRPRLFDKLALQPEWKSLTATDWWKSLSWPDELSTASDELRGQLDQLPLDVLDMLGTEVVVIGRNVAEGGPWGLLCRLSSTGKLAVESTQFEGVLGGRVEHEHPTVPGAPYFEASFDGQPFFYARDLDLLVASQDEALVQDVLATAHGGQERSVGLSRIVSESMPRGLTSPEDGFDLAFTANLAHLLPASGLLDGSVPDRDLLSDALPKIVDVSHMLDSVGRLQIVDGRVTLRAHADVDVDAVASDTGGLLGRPAFLAKQRLEDVFALLPEDIAATLTLNIDLRRALGVLVDAMDPELRTLVDSTLRDVSRLGSEKIQDAPSLALRLSRIVEDEITIAVRKNYHEVPEGSQPLPSIAIVLRLRDGAGWSQLEDFFLRGHDYLGLSPKRMFQIDEGVGTRKYAELTGLSFGEVAWMVLEDKMLLLSNDNDLLGNMVSVYSLHKPSVAGSRTVTGDRVRALLQSFEPLGGDKAQGNAAGWVDTARLLEILDPYGEYLADLDSQLDFATLREQERAKLVATTYAGELTPQRAKALEAELDAILLQRDAQRQAEVVPQLARAWRESLQWMTLAHQGVFALRLGERGADLHLSVGTVLE
ncbi:MAG: hypothetical protein H6825_15890 [Planctomycetes bacterium]|nr:hypothetical protein [Planctomycetota bacterium]